MLRLKNLTVGVNSKIILKRITLDFKKDKVYAIMGPNGSGKSTLAYAIAGHPGYFFEQGDVFLNGEKITELDPDKRARKGIFLSFQSPLQLSGVNVFQLLRVALEGKVDPVELNKKILELADKLKIRKDLIKRSLNEGASGGERKKLELLQAAVLDPKVAIFDEIDTGLDVDSLRIIGEFIDRWRYGRTIILITHYSRILNYVKPDEVIVLAEGEIVARGNPSLVSTIETEGYKAVIKNNNER